MFQLLISLFLSLFFAAKSFAAPPTNVQFSGANVSSVSVSWDLSAGTSYVMVISSVSNFQFLISSAAGGVNQNTTSYSALDANTTLFYKVKISTDPDNFYSSSIATATLSTIPGSAVSTFTVIAVSSLTAQWTANGNPPGTLYVAEVSTWNGFAGAVTSSATYSLSVTTRGLTQQNSYYVRVKARNHNNLDTAYLNLGSSLFQIDVTSPAVTGDLSILLLTETSGILAWTAPGDDFDSVTNSSGAYDVRYSTLPISDLTLFLQARSVTDFGTIPLSTSTPGVQETILLNGLSLDATYYFALRTQDEIPLFSPLSNGATIFTPDLIPPGAIQGLGATANKTEGKRIDLAWQNPADADLKGIRILIKIDGFAASPSETGGVTRFDFTRSSSLPVLPSSFTHTQLTLGVTYFYTLFTFDDELAPNYSAGVFVSTVPVPTQLTTPSRPTNVRGTRSGDGQSFSISWDPVTTRLTGEPFEPLELSSYTIYRLQAINGSTNQIFSVPSSSKSFLDATLFDRVLFYKVRAVNVGGIESEDSETVSSDLDNTVYLTLDDGISYVSLPGDIKLSLDANQLTLTGRRELSQEGGKTFKSLTIEVKGKNSGEIKKGFVFDEPIQIGLGYLIDAGGRVSNGSDTQSGAVARAVPLGGVSAPAFAQVLPQASEAQNVFSIYWFNGTQWLKLGTQVDTANKIVSVKSKHVGSYQLRLVQQGLSVQSNSIYPRSITPNGDGINDFVFFFFENPTDLPVSGTIYDLTSSKIVNVKRTDIFAGNNTVLTWDGKDDTGAVVAGGVYLYKIEIGDKTFTGTVAVAR